MIPIDDESARGRLAACFADLRRNVVELRCRLRTDRGNCGQADDDDQRQHHGVLDCCRAIFGFQETTHFRSETVHIFLHSVAI